jgi:hypothetical protein
MINRLIKINHGTVFPSAMVFAAYIILLFGFISIFSNWILGSILILFSIFIGFSYSGIDINLKERKYREYSICFGIKFGKWQSLDKFAFLAILANREVSEVHSRSNMTTSTGLKYSDVCMLDQTHREKILIKRFKDADSALDYAKNLSGNLNFDLTDYNPFISEKTEIRRYRRLGC